MDNLSKLEKAVTAAEAELERLRARKAAVLAGLGSEAPSEKIRAELLAFSVDLEIGESRVRAALKDLREHFEREIDQEIAALPARETALDEGVRAAWREAGQMVAGGLRILKQLGPPASRLIDGIEGAIPSLGEFEGALWASGAAQAAMLPEPPAWHEELSSIRALKNLKNDRGLRSLRVNGRLDRSLAKIRERNEK